MDIPAPTHIAAHVGTVAAGRIGTAVLKRLKPFDVHLHYFDPHRLPREVEEELGVTYHENVENMRESRSNGANMTSSKVRRGRRSFLRT